MIIVYLISKFLFFLSTQNTCTQANIPTFLSVNFCFQVMEYLSILSYVPQVLTVGQAAGRYWSGRCNRNVLLNTVAGAMIRPTVVKAGGHLGLALSTDYPEVAAIFGALVAGVAFDGAMTLTGEKFGYCKNAADGVFAMAAITAVNDGYAGMAVATAYYTPECPADDYCRRHNNRRKVSCRAGAICRDDDDDRTWRKPPRCT